MRRSLLLAMLAFSPACSDIGPGSGDLDPRHRDWRALGIENYSYRLRQSCFCAIFPNDVVVQVQSRQVVGVRSHQTGEEVPSSQWQFYYSIDGLFDMLERERETADSMAVEYHPTQFFPVKVTLDRIKQAIDDELYLEAGELDPIP